MEQDSEYELTGIYKFYLDNELVGEHKNALTTSGRSIIIKSLLGIIPDFANSIAYGIDGTANTLNSSSTLITNTSLGFEVGRSPVVGGDLAISGSNDILKYFATIQDSYDYSIYEVGLYPSTNLNNEISVDSSTIFNFDFVDSYLKYGTASTASLTTASPTRIGTQMYVIPNGDATTNYIEKNLDQNSLSFIQRYTSQDLFRLAMFNPSSTAASMNFRFYSDSNNHYTLTFVSPAASGYHVINLSKGSAVISGDPSWDNTLSVRMWNSSSHAILLDGLRIDSGPNSIDTNFGMISRATLPVPIVKPASIPLTIEYNLMINFSGGV